VIGIDAFVDAYPRSVKLTNIEAMRGDPRITFLEADLRSDRLEPIVEGCDAIVNEAAMAGLSRSWSDFELYSSCNLGGLARLIDAAASAGVSRFVQISTSSVYGRSAVGDETIPTRPVSPYGVTKLAAEHLVQAHLAARRLPAVILRYFSVYGPRQRPDMAFSLFINAMLMGQPITIFGDGSQSRTNTYVSDIVRGTIDALRSAPVGGIFNLSGSFAMSVSDAIRLISEQLGLEPVIQYADERTGDQDRTAGDYRRATAAFGYAPQVAPEEGLARQIEWFLRMRARDS
jgi:nucleoside-diphosphate-sugar epimerase